MQLLSGARGKDSYGGIRSPGETLSPGTETVSQPWNAGCSQTPGRREVAVRPPRPLAAECPGTLVSPTVQQRLPLTARERGNLCLQCSLSTYCVLGTCERGQG